MGHRYRRQSYYIVNETPEIVSAIRDLLDTGDASDRLMHIQWKQSIFLIEDDPHDSVYLSFERDDDVAAMIDLMADLGVYLAPYTPYVGEGWT